MPTTGYSSIPCQVGRDFGNEIEILSGVGAQDRVIVNPADSLLSGAQVRIKPACALGFQLVPLPLNSAANTRAKASVNRCGNRPVGISVMLRKRSLNAAASTPPAAR